MRKNEEQGNEGCMPLGGGGGRLVENEVANRKVGRANEDREVPASAIEDQDYDSPWC